MCRPGAEAYVPLRLVPHIPLLPRPSPAVLGRCITFNVVISSSNSSNCTVFQFERHRATDRIERIERETDQTTQPSPSPFLYNHSRPETETRLDVGPHPPSPIPPPPSPLNMPSPAPLLRPVQTPRPPQMRRANSLRAPLQTDGPTPPSLLHSPLLNATTRGPAIYPTVSPAASQPSSRRPSESASSISSSSSRASSHFSATSNASSTSAVPSFTYPVPASIPPHTQRSRFPPSTETRPPSSAFHTRSSPHSWSSPAASSTGHPGEFDDDPWRILDTVPASPHRGSPQTPTSSASTPLSVRAATTTTVPPGNRAQHTHIPHPPLSLHAQIGSYAPPELSSHQQSWTPTRRLGSGIIPTPLVSNGVGNGTPNSTHALRSRPHSSP